MYPQRCTDPHPHGSWTGFTCAGHDPVEFERQLTKAFGPE
jgi:hypothetical protein